MLGCGPVPVVAYMSIDGTVTVLAGALCELGSVAAGRVVEVVTHRYPLVESWRPGGGRAADAATTPSASTSARGGLRCAASATAPPAVGGLHIPCGADRGCAGADAAGESRQMRKIALDCADPLATHLCNKKTCVLVDLGY